MGLFLQYALFPGSKEDAVRKALETAAENPDFFIRLAQCRYAESEEGTQAFIDGDLEPEPFARALFLAAAAPVMVLHIYDGDCWGYDFYAGNEEDHFHTCPDYFDTGHQDGKNPLAGNPAMLAGWFPVQDISAIKPYLIHWSEWDGDKLEKMGKACPGDEHSYGDCWQVTDFAARLGFPWAFDEIDRNGHPPFPVLKDILEQSLPPCWKETASEERSLLWELPSSFSHAYIRRLLTEDGVGRFAFENKTPREIMDAVNAYRRSVTQAERDPLCQRLAVLGAFCAYWTGEGNPWGFLDNATYEPVCLRYEKPSDVYVLRARAAVTDFVKRHRAVRDLKRLMELDPAQQEIYQAELKLWEERENQWKERNEAARKQSIR